VVEEALGLWVAVATPALALAICSVAQASRLAAVTP
jgi:hypothetical protein